MIFLKVDDSSITVILSFQANLWDSEIAWKVIFQATRRGSGGEICRVAQRGPSGFTGPGAGTHMIWRNYEWWMSYTVFYNQWVVYVLIMINPCYQIL